MPRSGTNFLMDLLCSHPDVAPGRWPVKEDLFLEHCDHLVRFVTNVREAWDPIWGEFPPDIEADLLRSIGDGLISFLWTDRTRRLVTKSPGVKNIPRFHQLFPDAKLLILIRDGRSIVQSCVDTFGWDFDTAAYRFAEAGRELTDWLSAGGQTSSSLVVRYEELVNDLGTTMMQVLDFLGLSWAAFDFSEADALPVRGSSFHRGAGRSAVHWDPVPKDSSFQPLQRWSSWDEGKLERFEWIAGRESRDLGYETALGKNPQALSNRMRDLWWHVGKGRRRAVFKIRGRLGPLTRPLRDRMAALIRGETR